MKVKDPSRKRGRGRPAVYLRVYDELRKEICDGGLPEGHRLLTIAQLCKKHSLSRTAVRKAVAKLSAEGLILALPGRGLFVGSSRRRKETGGGVSRKGRAVRFIVPGIDDPFVSAIHRGLADELSKHGLAVNVRGADWLISRERDNIRQLLSSSSSGAVILPATGQLLRDDIQTLIDNGFPSVLVDRAFEGMRCSLVASDHIHGATLAVDHLIRLGHKRIGMIVPLPSTSAQERYDGYAKALDRAGIAVDESLVVRLAQAAAGHEAKPRMGGFDEMRQLLALPQRPTAVFGGNDHLALGACWAIQQAGLQTPQDISVVGFDGLGVEAMVPGGITTVRQPAETIGREAARLIIEQVQHLSTGGVPAVIRRVYLRAEGLSLGATTGPPPADRGRSRRGS